MQCLAVFTTWLRLDKRVDKHKTHERHIAAGFQYFPPKLRSPQLHNTRKHLLPDFGEIDADFGRVSLHALMWDGSGSGVGLALQ